ncbi:MAG TPA: SCP2 sterol-binding domain-containing protein [Acidimicrobiia bacterium]|jgi:putative sterol carrier protein
MTAPAQPYVVAYVVAKGKKQLSRRAVRVDGQSVTDLADDDASEPDVTFTMTPEVASEFDAGALDVNVGFMRGAIKMSGDSGALLRVLPALKRAANP